MLAEKPESILLVEDDPGHARLIERNLQRAHITNEFVTLSDGQQAVDYLFAVVVWWALLGIALAAEPPSAASPGSAGRGAPHVFVRYCSACHGMHGRGDGPAASVLQPPPADLTRITQRHDGLFPVAEITALIDGRTVLPAHGSREMPIWGVRFGEMGGGGPAGEAVVHDVLRMLIDYLRAIQQ